MKLRNWYPSFTDDDRPDLDELEIDLDNREHNNQKV